MASDPRAADTTAAPEPREASPAGPERPKPGGAQWLQYRKDEVTDSYESW